MSELNESRRAVLQAVCDTVVPSIEHDPDPTGLWSRSATDMGADQGIEQVFGQLPEEKFEGMMELLDALGQQGFAGLSQRSREQVLRNFSMVGSRGGRRHFDARRPDPVHHVRRSGPGDGPEPELGGVRLPGPDRRAHSEAEDDRADRAGRGRARRSRPTCASWAPARAAA